MTFPESLKKYMTDIPCSASELSAVSGLAPSMISRYLRSEQIPGEKAVRRLAAGLDFLSRDKGGPSLNPARVSQALTESLYGIAIDYSLFIRNLQALLSALNINNNELAKSLNFDPSYISRILSGSRKPANLYQFLTHVSDYITGRFYDTPQTAVIADITECDVKELSSREILAFTIRRYLGSHIDTAAEIMPRFLVKVDTFDLNEYRENEKTSSLAAGTSLPSSPAYYYGQAGIIQANHDFLTLTGASSSTDDVILFRDIPIGESREAAGFSTEFSEKMHRLTAKNLSIHCIVDVHRSFGELLNELYQWLPYYMSGRVRPYYIKEPTNHVLMHNFCVSGAAYVEGSGIFRNPNNCRCVLSTASEDIHYARERASDLLSYAQPLMDIYDVSRKEKYAFDKKAMFISGGDYIMVRTVPPLFAMSSSLLDRILARCRLPEAEEKDIRSTYVQMKNTFEEIISNGSLFISLPKCRKENTLYLSLPGLFRKERIAYTASEYKEHIRDLENYAACHRGVSIAFEQETPLQNTELLIHCKKSVLISKGNAPEIHFTIHYPRLVQAFESYAASLKG